MRYADDWLLGFGGSKAEAEELKREIRTFLSDTLKLELSEEQTLMTHARTGAAKFLGYQIVAQQVDDKLDRRGQRQVNETIGLGVPKEVMEQKCALYVRKGKPAQRAEMQHDSDYSSVSKSQSEYRGVVQYSILAHHVGWFSKWRWRTETSLLKTLAGKHKSSGAALARKYKATTETAYGLSTCFKVVVQRGGDKKPRIAQFGGIPLKRKQDAILVAQPPQFALTNRSELLQRVFADTCELCGSKEKVAVHHIRKLAELKQPGRKENPEWVKQMIARRRKTRVVCRKCHEAIQAGTATASFRSKGTGEPRDAKVSRVVREEANGKGS